MEYLIHILILVGVYIILSISLNLILGYTGLLSISHGIFFGLGAYISALLALNLKWPFIINTICAVIMASVLGAIIAIPSLRIRSDYFAIITFSFQIVVFNVITNWVSVTRGPMGLPGIPQPKIFIWIIDSNIKYFFLVYGICLLVYFVSNRIVSSPFGRVLKAIREDEIWAQSMGKQVGKYKILVFMIGSGLAALAGSIYAYYISFIDPSSFSIMESIFIISVVIIGGAGNLWGSIIGSIVLVSLPELLRFVGLSGSIASNFRQILYGSLLILFLMFRSKGFLGEFSFKIISEK